ncbi:MAG: hypothetical protein ACU0GG_04490 [Paracoccaceae bacterium]
MMMTAKAVIIAGNSCIAITSHYSEKTIQHAVQRPFSLSDF